MDSTNKPDSILKDVLPENASMQAQTGSNDWSHKTLEKLLFASINEQKTRRRWNIFFRLITLSFVALIFWQWLGPDRSAAPALNERHTAVVDIDGVIEAGDTNSAKVVIAGLRKAFADKTAAGVILRINSPGGSPVQANMINDEMLRLRKQHPEKPLYVVVEEMCASGGYYIAVAADKIFCASEPCHSSYP